VNAAQERYLESKTNQLSRLSGSRKELRQRDEFAKQQVAKAQNALFKHLESCSARKATNNQL
jgi:hypothetical protein